MNFTEHSGHAKEIAQSMDVQKLNGILFCSGDGLIYEVSLKMSRVNNYK